MSVRPEFAGIDNDQLATLVFELASQLHVERARRLALEAALAAAGVIAPGALESAAESPTVREAAGHAVDDSIRKLLRALSESADERTPLRGEAPRDSSGGR